jgi:hypothetical protein
MRAPSFTLCLLVALAAELGPRATFAASPTGPGQAEAVIREGVSLRMKGRDLEALETFRRAQALGGGARALAQIALAEQALGRWVEAERDLAAALAAPNDPWIAMHRKELGDSLADIRDHHLGSLEILDAVGGARIVVNGQPAGTIPLAAPLRLPAGSITLEVNAPGYLPFQRSVVIPAGGLARESVTLAPVTAAPASALREERVAATAPVSSTAWRRPTAIAALAGAGVALGVGIAFQVIRYGRVNEYNDHPGCGTGLNDDGVPGCHDLGDSARSAQAFAIAGYAGAAVLGGVGAYLLLSSPGSAEPVATARASCAPAAGAWGLACAGRF